MAVSAYHCLYVSDPLLVWCSQFLSLDLDNWPRLNLAHACLDIRGLKYMGINAVYSAPPSTLLPLLTKSKILQPEFQYACVLEELYHCQPWVNPIHCGLCCAEKNCRLGVVYCDECYTLHVLC